MNKPLKYLISLILSYLSCSFAFSQTIVPIGTAPGQINVRQIENQLVDPSIAVNDDEDLFFIADTMSQQIKVFTKNGDLHQVMNIPISLDLLHFSVTNTQIIIGYPTKIEIWNRGDSLMVSTQRVLVPMSNFQILTGHGLIQIIYLGVNPVIQVLEETSGKEILRLAVENLDEPVLFNYQGNRLPITKTINSTDFHIAAIKETGNIWWQRKHNGYTRIILQDINEKIVKDIQIKNTEVSCWSFGNTELFVSTMNDSEISITAQ